MRLPFMGWRFSLRMDSNEPCYVAALTGDLVFSDPGLNDVANRLIVEPRTSGDIVPELFGNGKDGDSKRNAASTGEPVHFSLHDSDVVPVHT
jgi:hypothetical protein